MTTPAITSDAVDDDHPTRVRAVRSSEQSTWSTHVYEEIRDDVLNGRIAPGERLKLAALSERFGLSMTVIREALTRLAEQGLVVASPKRGFAVTPLSVEDLEDLTRTRVSIESLALRDSIEHGDLAWESTLVAAYHALVRTPPLGNGSHGDATWRQAHRQFHQALVAGCGSPRLIAIANELRDNADVYRAWSRAFASDPSRSVDDEHRVILEATLHRDADTATRALVDHIEGTTEGLLRYARTL